MTKSKTQQASDSLREGVSGLYKQLTAERIVDETFERERLSVLARLNLVPDKVMLSALGATSQFDSSKAR